MADDDKITARAIEQALNILPEPTLEQAQDAVALQLRTIATGEWDGESIDSLAALTTIRRLEHATRLLRGAVPDPVNGEEPPNWPPRLTITPAGAAGLFLLTIKSNAGKQDQDRLADLLELYWQRGYDAASKQRENADG